MLRKFDFYGEISFRYRENLLKIHRNRLFSKSWIFLRPRQRERNIVAGLISIVYFCLPQNKKGFGGGNFGGTRQNQNVINVLWKIYYFRVFYLESVSPEPRESSIIMKIGFKFAKIEYFRNSQ